MGILLFRLDDISPWMDWERFERIHQIFKKYGVAPLIGIVPDNRDEKLNIGDEKTDFWEYMGRLEQEEGWVLSQHGYQHTYVTNCGGMLKVNGQSEFAGLPLGEQETKIRAGKEILQKHGIHATMFMAPSHSYDKATLKALKALDFEGVTDGYTDRSYRRDGLVFIPCTVSKPVIPKDNCVNTACYHPNMMSDEEFKELEAFLEKHAEVCQSYGIYLQQLEKEQLPQWNFQLVFQQCRNLALRKLKRYVASNRLCQAYFRRREAKKSL